MKPKRGLFCNASQFKFIPFVSERFANNDDRSPMKLCWANKTRDNTDNGWNKSNRERCELKTELIRILSESGNLTETFTALQFEPSDLPNFRSEISIGKTYRCAVKKIQNTRCPKNWFLPKPLLGGDSHLSIRSKRHGRRMEWIWGRFAVENGVDIWRENGRN